MPVGHHQRLATASVCLSLLFGTLACRPPATPSAAPKGPPDIVIADFEQEGFVGFEPEGYAFGLGPQRRHRSGQDLVTGYEGTAYVSSYSNNPGADTGALTSQEFLIDRAFINFLVGGKYDTQALRVELLIAGEVKRSATGNAGDGFEVDHLGWKSWDVRDLRGQRAIMRLVDENASPDGHLLVDQILMSNAPPPRRELRDRLLADANISVARLAGRVATDDQHPVYHLAPASRWMNDPNGPVYHAGQYHLFFQHNPYGDSWGNMHWGHFRSKDLVSWERLPIALWPSLDVGESHCFSGCAVSRPDGRLMLIYTSIGIGPPSQWGAISRDTEALEFDKLGNNPLLAREIHGDLSVKSWRDPFVFREDNVWYMVVGGHPEGGKGSAFLYRSPDLQAWQYVGIVLGGQEENWECPALFRLGDRWVLLYSPHGLVRYHTGDLDLKTGAFTAKTGGIVDLGRGPLEKTSHMYAPTVMHDPAGGGRQLMFGWVRGFAPARGWNGAMTVPRVLSLDQTGKLLQAPAPEIDKLHSPGFSLEPTVLKERTMLLQGISGDAFDLKVRITLMDSRRAGLKLRRSASGGRAVVLGFDGLRLLIDDQVVNLEKPTKTLELRVLMDRSMIEVFVDGGRQVISRTLRSKADETGIEIFSAGGEALFEGLQIWPMRSIWQ